MAVLDVRALELLRAAIGGAAIFRPGQLEAIEELVERRSRVLVVQATGWGKSLVYFIATKLLREGGAGPTLLISPLLSLMRDQIRMAERLGVDALSLTSENTDDWPAVKRALEGNRCDILLVSPERLGSEEFQTEVVPLLRPGIGLLVVDEAHCISDWGHDFRPDYRRIVRTVQRLPPGVPVLATTATANDRVVEDVAVQLGPGLRILRGPLARGSLRLQSIVLTDQAERLAWLAQHLSDLPGSGIVYCLTVADCVRVTAWLRQCGHDVAAYFADLPADEKTGLERRLLADDIKALVATVAFGMGFDKPDLGFVVHYQRPGSVVAYYQQIGRAGRALDDAVVVLLNGREDDEIHAYFIGTAFPGVELLKEVLHAVEANPGIRAQEIERLVNARRGKITQALKFVEIDRTVYREGGGLFRTPNPWAPDLPGWASVTERREHELAEIRAFSTADSCLMELVTRALDDPHAERCGRCAVCSDESQRCTGLRPPVFERGQLALATDEHTQIGDIRCRRQQVSVTGEVGSGPRAALGRGACRWASRRSRRHGARTLLVADACASPARTVTLSLRRAPCFTRPWRNQVKLTELTSPIETNSSVSALLQTVRRPRRRRTASRASSVFAVKRTRTSRAWRPV